MKASKYFLFLLIITISTSVFAKQNGVSVNSDTIIFSKEFYIYKTRQDFLNGKKFFYGTYKSHVNGKFKLDSAGILIKVNVDKMGIFAYEYLSAKWILTEDKNGGQVYIGGNKYTYALCGSLYSVSYDSNGYATGFSTLLLPITFYFYKIDNTGTPVQIKGKRTWENLPELLKQYPGLLSQYEKEKENYIKHPKSLFFWSLNYFRKYADYLAEDMEGK